MPSSVGERVRTRREALRAAGLRPIPNSAGSWMPPSPISTPRMRREAGRPRHGRDARRCR
nr:antitoxin MazE-like protein [Methylobacterium organophilum]